MIKSSLSHVSPSNKPALRILLGFLWVYLLVTMLPPANFTLAGRLLAQEAQDGGIGVRVDGALMEGDSPVIDNGRVLIPLRSVVEYLNGKVLWYPDEQQVIGFRGARGFDLIIGAAKAYLSDGTVYPLDVPARIIGGRTYVPLRFVSEATGCMIEWDGLSRTAVITTAPVDTAKEVGELARPLLLQVTTDTQAGSGFLFTKDGQVITCSGLVSGAKWIRVKTAAGVEYAAEALIVDPMLNLAKLRINKTQGEEFPVFRYFDDFSGIAPEEAIFALGSPLFDEKILQPGMVSEKAPAGEIRGGINTYNVTTLITPENNGGPAVKENGALIGVNCLSEKDGAVDAYVIPIEYVFSMRNR